MDTRTLQISRPCPVDLDVDRSGRQFFCDHCQKDVHVLANWPRAEAEAFIAENRGRSVCISLRRNRDGELQYADSPPRTRPAELVPVTRLRRRWLPEAAAAAGVAAVLSACTPHGPVQGLESDEDTPAQVVAGGIQVPNEIAPPPEPCEVLEGKMGPPEPRMVRGEMAVVEPPQVPPPAPKKTPKKAPAKVPDEQMVDGGIDF